MNKIRIDDHNHSLMIFRLMKSGTYSFKKQITKIYF